MIEWKYLHQHKMKSNFIINIDNGVFYIQNQNI